MRCGSCDYFEEMGRRIIRTYTEKMSYEEKGVKIGRCVNSANQDNLRVKMEDDEACELYKMR